LDRAPRACAAPPRAAGSPREPVPRPRGRLKVSGGQYPPDMAHFAVRLVHGPGWDPTRPIREQDGWDEHAAFMDGLVDDGFVILGGPVGNGEQTLHVVEAADEQDIETRLARDPWASARLLQIGVIEPWALWLDSRPKLAVRHRPEAGPG
jgi:uncharacterized protein YciI